MGLAKLLQPCLAAALLLGLAQAQAPNAYVELEKWIVDNGGMINTKISTNKDGFRGLFTKVAAKEGDHVATIPSACMINAGPLDSSVMTGTLVVLRELLDPFSRFKPFIKVWPKPGQVLNACTFPAKYLPLLDSEYWARSINITQNYLNATLHSETNPELDFTIKEMIGNAKVSLDDLKYACAVSSTRYVTVELRKRLMMIPIFDMKNHKRQCVHTTSALDGHDEIHIVAGKDVEAGEELCYSYHDRMRDDYGVVNYGFLPELEDPPRLLTIDHHEFDPERDHQDLSEQPFAGNRDQVNAEIIRLESILARLAESDKALESQAWPRKGEDWMLDTVMGLRQRRRNALKLEVARLRAALVDPKSQEL